MAQSSSEAIQYHTLQNFTFHNGTTLPEIRLAYQVINPEKTSIAVVHTCFRGRIASTLTHSRLALGNHKIILIALLGNGESSSPSNTPGFPDTVEYMDCITAQHDLLSKKLRVEEVDVMLGFSMGGQITYHWITSYPDFVRNAVIVCSSAKTSRHNYQFLEGPRAALEAARSEEVGIRAFGKAYSAWLTSAEWFDDEGYRALGFESLRDWDDVVTVQGYQGWSGKDLLGMLGMWQRGDVARCVDGEVVALKEALGRIEARVLLMPCETDQYFRPIANKREVRWLKRGEVEVVPSIWGHIAGGGANEEDVKWMNGKIEEFLKEGAS